MNANSVKEKLNIFSEEKIKEIKRLSKKGKKNNQIEFDYAISVFISAFIHCYDTKELSKIASII